MSWLENRILKLLDNVLFRYSTYTYFLTLYLYLNLKELIILCLRKIGLEYSEEELVYILGGNNT